MTVVDVFSCFFFPLLTALYRHYALARKCSRYSNDRSSHISSDSTRGSGMAFVVVFWCTYWFCYEGRIAQSEEFGLGGGVYWWQGLGSLMIIVLSVCVGDYFGSFFVLSGFALWVYRWSGIIVPFGWNPQLEVLMSIFALLYLVWMLNLYNFMDGIDGLAALESIFVRFGGSVYLLVKHGGLVDTLLPCLGSVVAGFFMLESFQSHDFYGGCGEWILWPYDWTIVDLQVSHVHTGCCFGVGLILSGVSVVTLP